MLKSIFKYRHLIALPVFLFIQACGNIPRDNPLDPQNPESTSTQKHLIEVFVNISDHPSDYNQTMLTALDSLEHLYPDRLVVAAYHRNVDGFSDPCHRAANDIRYDKLLDAGDFRIKGVPDCYFNGISQRVQGASTVEQTFYRLEEALIVELAMNYEYSLNVTYTIDSGEMTINVTLARLGNQSARDIRLRAMLIADKSDDFFQNTVIADGESDLIQSLPQGTIREIQLPVLALSGDDPLRLIVAVMNENADRAYQAEWLDIDE